MGMRTRQPIYDALRERLIKEVRVWSWALWMEILYDLVKAAVRGVALHGRLSSAVDEPCSILGHATARAARLPVDWLVEICWQALRSYRTI